jgi:ubiquinone/menaquinone biosynthesis C-methylase UbiE
MDAYKIEYPEKTFTGAIASFWLSHIRKEKINEWVEQLQRTLKPGAHVFIADNT